MLYKFRDKIGRAGFKRKCAAILHTSPIVVDDSCGLLVLSQLQHKDVLMFLLALKSFAAQISIGRVVVLNDGSLTGDDESLLNWHMPGLTLLRLPEYRSAACPTGGTWERLLAISSFVRDYYVLQLDSDTLTIGPIEEVRDCIKQQRVFALGTWDNQDFESMRERSLTARSLKPGVDSHVQLVAEANFDKLREFETLRYVRGCSGFAGFAKGSFTREFVEAISAEMRAAIGIKWSEWGSEQVMSNIVVANVPHARVLPHPKYADCQKMKLGETEFVHFIGSCRFRNGTYARLGAKIVASL